MIPSSIRWEEIYLSPLATATLIGRKDELDAVEKAIRDHPHRYVIYITGQGGIGKTRLLQHILQNPPEGLALQVATRPVDMYHTINHTVEGFIQSIQEVISPDGRDFELYLQEREIWRRIPGEESKRWQEQRKSMIRSLLQDWNTLAQKTRILIGLDTVERLFLQDDPVAHELGLPIGTPLVYNWLLEDFLPQLQNTVIVLAGRPVSVHVEEELQRIGKFVPISLSGFTEEEALEYFRALTSLLQKSSEPRDQIAADRLSQWNDDLRRMFFYALRDDGTVRPIFLALAVDYLTITGQPFPLGQSLSEVQGLSMEERKRLQDDLLRGVEEEIRNALHPTEEVVKALGWLHRGADENLLGQVTNMSGETLREACERVRRLSFVKIRPADQRLFLHDEMYVLLRDLRGAIPETVFRPVQEYYGALVDQIKKSILNLYESQLDLPPLDQVALETARLREAILEDLHYKLHWRPREGFDQYFVYAEEALAMGDRILDMELRAELMEFLREEEPFPAGVSGNIPLPDVRADSAVRWIKREISLGRYEEALALIQKLRGSAGYLVETGDALIRADLDIADATVQLYQGNLNKAQEWLSKVQQDLRNFQVSPESRVRFNVVMGRLYNHWGYIRRVQGQFIAAEDNYRKALPYWRAINMEAEQANTLTNLAFALALQGRFDVARRQAQDALKLRMQLGMTGAVALTLNTLAQIEIYAGQYRDAEGWALRALTVAQGADFPRGKGLAHLSLASTYRYMSEPPCPATNRREWLEKSLEHSRKAREIFSQEPIEPERLGTAYYEEAIALREFCRPPLMEGINVEQYARQSEESFQQAMKIAEEHELWALYLDVGMGLAWLYYYAKEKEKLASHLEFLEKLFRERFKSYQIAPSAPPLIGGDTILAVFPQMGRWHILQGVMALDGFNPSQESQQKPPYSSLRKAAREFALALEYDTMVAENFRDLRRALNLIYERLKILNVAELRAFYETIKEMADEYSWKPCEEWRFWKELVAHFGPYEELGPLAL